MNPKKLHEETLLVKRKVFEAIPTDVSFASIIIALAELIKELKEQEVLGEDD